ncbi:TIGR03618 family F420-dependent PPOX class oxidoreductase [Actinosynnema sp. NPDC053489]|uniref:TIGR03618 family F420-dependent PPOX class oxidoreductase n=1 Tax=Actinosynnema sp. NPDC053489 TaxID=3363916 RepID=UPI0037CB2C93
MSTAMREMSDGEWREFVGHGTRTGKLATVRADGRPHVAPVSFVVHGPEVLFFTGPDTVKGRALRHRPHFALCVDDERPPFAFVLLEGEARVEAERGQVRDWARRIAARYLGEAHADAVAERSGELGEVLVRGRITRVVARSGHADRQVPRDPHEGRTKDMGSDRIEREVVISAPVQQVWAALTEPEHVGRWFGSGAPARIEPRPGGIMHLDHGEHGQFPTTIRVIDPPHRFAYLWAAAHPGEVATEANATLVEFTVAPHGDGSLVRLVESGFDALDIPEDKREGASFESHAAGWADALEGLRQHVEGLRPSARGPRPAGDHADQPA